MWLAEQILEQAEEQFHDPARIRAQLEQVDEARRRGELSEEECAEIENELLQRLMYRRALTRSKSKENRCPTEAVDPDRATTNDKAARGRAQRRRPPAADVRMCIAASSGAAGRWPARTLSAADRRA